MDALSTYQNQVKVIQDDYRNTMDLYKVQADVYKGQMTQYLEDLARYNITRASAVRAGEGLIESVNEKYDWAWINKRDSKIYIPWLLKAWLAQGEIMVVYFLIILFLIKRKDVK